MFQLHAAIALGLIALAAGTALLMLTGKEGVACKYFGRIVSMIVIVASILTMLCATYYGVRYWEDGYFRYPHGMTIPSIHDEHGGKGMGEEKMKCCSMMEGGMKGMMKKEKTELPETTPSNTHSEHH